MILIHRSFKTAGYSACWDVAAQARPPIEEGEAEAVGVSHAMMSGASPQHQGGGVRVAYRAHASDRSHSGGISLVAQRGV